MSWETIKIEKREVQAFEQQFRRNAKFYADEDMDSVVIEIMRDLDLNTVTAKEAGLLGRDDAAHLAYAKRQDRILVTRDHDYLDDRKHPPNRCPGVVVLDIHPLTRESLTDALYLLRSVVRPYRQIWTGAKVLIGKESQITVWDRSHATGRRRKTRYRLVKGRQAQEWLD